MIKYDYDLTPIYNKETMNYIDSYRYLGKCFFSDFIKAKNDKGTESVKYINNDQEEAFEHLFLWYNGKKATNILMFDIDYNHEQFPTTESYYNEIIEKTNLTPYFVTKTNNGYQFAIKLHEPFYHQNDYQKETPRQIKKAITKLLRADIQGSHRLNGWWRNPLRHSNIFTGKMYEKETLIQMFCEKERQTKNKSTQLDTSKSNYQHAKNGNIKGKETIEGGFVIGNRNAYLNSICCDICYKDRSKLNELDTMIIDINNSFDEEGLSDKECLDIASYIKKEYAPKWKRFKAKENIEETKSYEKGILSDFMWEHGIHNDTTFNKETGEYITIKDNRKTVAGLYTSIKRKKETINKLNKAIKNLALKGILNPSNSLLAEEVNISSERVRQLKKEKELSFYNSLLTCLIEDINSYKTNSNIATSNNNHLELSSITSYHKVSYTKDELIDLIVKSFNLDLDCNEVKLLELLNELDINKKEKRILLEQIWNDFSSKEQSMININEIFENVLDKYKDIPISLEILIETYQKQL